MPTEAMLAASASISAFECGIERTFSAISSACYAAQTMLRASVGMFFLLLMVFLLLG
jgi:hypothetical protein